MIDFIIYWIGLITGAYLIGEATGRIKMPVWKGALASCIFALIWYSTMSEGMYSFLNF